MLKLLKVSCLALLSFALAEEITEVQDTAEAVEENGPSCEGYKTFDVMGQGFLNVSEWWTFTEKHPLFILGVSEGGCTKCCDSEKLLAKLLEKTESKEFTWPVKDTKKKQLIRKEIPVMRFDVKDKQGMQKLRELGLQIGNVPSVYFVRHGVARILQSGNFFSIDHSFFTMQRLS